MKASSMRQREEKIPRKHIHTLGQIIKSLSGFLLNPYSGKALTLTSLGALPELGLQNLTFYENNKPDCA